MKHISNCVDVFDNFRIFLVETEAYADRRISMYAAPCIDFGERIAIYLETNGNPVLLALADIGVEELVMVEDYSNESWWDETLATFDPSDLTSENFESNVNDLWIEATT